MRGPCRCAALEAVSLARPGTGWANTRTWTLSPRGQHNCSSGHSLANNCTQLWQIKFFLSFSSLRSFSIQAEWKQELSMAFLTLLSSPGVPVVLLLMLPPTSSLTMEGTKLLFWWDSLIWPSSWRTFYFFFHSKFQTINTTGAVFTLSMFLCLHTCTHRSTHIWLSENESFSIT